MKLFLFRLSLTFFTVWLLGSSAASVHGADDSFSMIFISDSQIPWWRGGHDPACDTDACRDQRAQETNQQLVSAINGITNLSTWPTMGLTKGGGSPVTTPRGVILNGDLTANYRPEEKALFDSYYAPLGVQLYPGLGNHDYANNVGQCQSNAIYFPDDNRCAKEAFWWMANQVGRLPNVVNHHAPGFVAVLNNSAFDIRFTVHYILNGVGQSSGSGRYPLLQWRTKNLPPGATSVAVVIDYNTGCLIEDVCGPEWLHLDTYHPANAAASCFASKGTLFNPDSEPRHCSGSAFPDGASGSLSYSFDIGNYHFVQLHNYPDYAVELPREITVEEVLTFGISGSPGVSVQTSWSWLENDLFRATAAGKAIIINLHNATGGDTISGTPTWQDPRFLAAIRNRPVAGIFGGHIHQDAGLVQELDNGLVDIPLILSGSAECRTLVYVDFHERHFNWSVVETTGGNPSWLNDPNWTCDTFGDYLFNGAVDPGRDGIVDEPEDMIGTFDFNTAPTGVEITVVLLGAKEGTPITFTASAIDTNGDALSYAWDFGDGTTASGPIQEHVFADSGLFTVAVTASDGFGGTLSATVDVPVANVAPTITAQGSVSVLNEGDGIELTGVIADAGAQDGLTLLVDWGDGSPSVQSVAGQGPYSLEYTYFDDVPTGTPSDAFDITVQVSDDDGGSDVAQWAVEVRNVAPIVDPVGAVIVENAVATVSGTITDPSFDDPFVVTIDWGEGASETFNYPARATSFAQTHQYLDDNPTGTPADKFPVTVTIADDDTGTGSAGTTVDVRNVAPSLQLMGSSIDEDGIASVVGTITDPGSLDTFSVEIDWGEGLPSTFSYPAGTTNFIETHRYLDDNPSMTPSDIYAVRAQITDDDTGIGTSGAAVQVSNVVPVLAIDAIVDLLGSVVGIDVDVVLAKQPLTMEASFSDKGSQDTHQGRVEWDDGSNEDLGTTTSPLSASHAFSLPGLYDVTVFAEDDDVGIGSATRTVEIVDAFGAILNTVEHLAAAAPNSRAKRRIEKAIVLLVGRHGGWSAYGAVGLLEKGKIAAAVRNIWLATVHIGISDAFDPSLDLKSQRRQLGLTARSIATDAIDAAMTDPHNRVRRKRVEQAAALVEKGDRFLTQGRVARAIGAFWQSVRLVSLRRHRY